MFYTFCPREWLIQYHKEEQHEAHVYTWFWFHKGLPDPAAAK